MQAETRQLEQGVVELLKKNSERVDEAIKQFLPTLDSAQLPEIRGYYEMVWDYNLRGGKRLRPALCMLSCEMFGESADKAMPTAAALEFLQNFLLVHDDIMDKSEMRRGKPCLHRLYGIPAAINAGDGLFAKAFEALNSNRQLLGASKTLKIMREFVKQLNYTVEGQALELAWISKGNWKISEKDYFKLVELKTAHYTVTMPLKLGAIIAGAPSKDLKAFDKLGLLLGTAFQIQDDVLNLVAEKGKYGKEIAGDLLEGKRTLVLAHLLKKCNVEERKFVEAALGKPRAEKSAEEIGRVLEMAKGKGSIDYATNKAREMGRQALEIFGKKFGHVAASPAKENLEKVLEFAVSRSY